VAVRSRAPTAPRQRVAHLHAKNLVMLPRGAVLYAFGRAPWHGRR